MLENALYVQDVKGRTQLRYYLGALARLKNFLKNQYAVWIARRNGAIIGEYVSISLKLARKANKNLRVGDHTSIQTTKLDLRAPVTLGKSVIIGSNVEIITCSHNIDSAEWEHKSYGIQIDDFVWIATNSMILPSCTHIGRGGVIAAGSVVSKKVLPMQVVAGNPAVFLRERTEVHYNLCVEGLLGNDLNTYLKVRKRKIANDNL